MSDACQDACHFDTLTLTREIGCPPDRLFALMTDRAARAIWSAPSEDVQIEIDECDIREGGREVASTATEFDNLR